MTAPTKKSHGEREIDRRAAEWVLREHEGLGADDRNALADWMRDPRHAAAYAEMKQTSEMLDGLRGQAPRDERPRRPGRVYWLAAGLAAAAAIAVFITGNSPPQRRLDQPPADGLRQTASTQVGEIKTLPLPDGSTIGLNTSTTVEVRYSAGERRVRLVRGEAFFVVAKNPRRPFWVEAGSVSLRAVGTAFDVRVRADSIEVLVQEGKVQVNRRGRAGEPLLLAGQQATVALSASTVPAGTTVATIETARLQSALAWQKHRLEFSDTPLSEVVEEFNRYNRRQLVIGDPALAARRFGGAFAATGSESFVEVLQQSFGVVAERHGDVTILRPAR